jgi:hypothetical protein
MGLYFDPIRGQWFPTSSVPVPGTVRLTVTITSSGSDDGETRRAERTQAVEQLYRVATAMVSTQALTGTVKDRNGMATASWTYTPTVPS